MGGEVSRLSKDDLSTLKETFKAISEDTIKHLYKRFENLGGDLYTAVPMIDVLMNMPELAANPFRCRVGLVFGRPKVTNCTYKHCHVKHIAASPNTTAGSAGARRDSTQQDGKSDGKSDDGKDDEIFNIRRTTNKVEAELVGPLEQYVCDFHHLVEIFNVFHPQARLEDKIKSAFKIYDFNNDNYIDTDDIDRIVRIVVEDKLNAIQLKQVANEIMNEADSAGHKVLTLKTFTDAVQKMPDFITRFQFGAIKK